MVLLIVYLPVKIPGVLLMQRAVVSATYSIETIAYAQAAFIRQWSRPAKALMREPLLLAAVLVFARGSSAGNGDPDKNPENYADKHIRYYIL
jgi:hypothetical protein